MQIDMFENLATILSPRIRLVFSLLALSLFFCILAGALSLPFYFESSSMLYKFGADKTLLRSGKVLGLIAACLILLQSVLSARFKFLDRIFALNNLMSIHRLNGILIAGVAVIHPVLIFLPEDMATIPFSLRYWPEYIGVFLLLMILGIVMVALFRLKLGLSFDRWRVMHQWAVFAAAIALFVHILFVSETFEKGLPRMIIFFAAGFYVLVFMRVRLKAFFIKKHPFTVSEITPAALEAYQMKIQPESGKIPSYLPGQFGFISINSENISPEVHPFTIASTPSRPESLEFVIRTSGDWTRNIGKINRRDRVYVDGPYGLFSHLRCRNNPEVIMIAGGIGITPMLGMLRFMADSEDSRKLTLIWSNRTRDHIIFPDEFNSLEKKLPNFRIIHVITDVINHNTKASGKNNIRKLDPPGLEKLLSDCSRLSAVFICGPPSMMTEIRKALVRIGFLRRRIFSERFSL